MERTAVGLALSVARRAHAFEVRRRRTAEGPIRVLIEVDSLDRGGLEEAVYQLVTHLDRRRSYE